MYVFKHNIQIDYVRRYRHGTDTYMWYRQCDYYLWIKNNIGCWRKYTYPREAYYILYIYSHTTVDTEIAQMHVHVITLYICLIVCLIHLMYIQSWRHAWSVRGQGICNHKNMWMICIHTWLICWYARYVTDMFAEVIEMYAKVSDSVDTYADRYEHTCIRIVYMNEIVLQHKYSKSTHINCDGKVYNFLNFLYFCFGTYISQNLCLREKVHTRDIFFTCDGIIVCTCSCIFRGRFELN